MSRLCLDIALHVEDPWSFSPCPSGPLECWIARSLSWFPRDLRSDWRCYPLLRRLVVDLCDGDMDVALPSITHSSHRTSTVVHFHVYRSICVPPLRFPLCTERSEVDVALDRINCQYVSVSLLKIFTNHQICFSFMCLHHQGWLHIPSSRKARPVIQSDCSGFYCTAINGEKRGASLGFGDFLFYNLMTLLALPPLPSSSIITQLWITVGSMISLAIEYSAMLWLE